MAILAGTWGPPTITGPEEITVDGVPYQVPDDAEIKLVHAGRIEVAHVKVWGIVVVLSARGQLVESEAEARLRASEPHWRSIWVS